MPRKIVPNIILSLIKAWLSSSETNRLWDTWITLFQLSLFRTSLLLFLLLNNSFVFDAIDYIILQCSVWAFYCKITSLSFMVLWMEKSSSESKCRNRIMQFNELKNYWKHLYEKKKKKNSFVNLINIKYY